jgi:DNA-binding FadR family transcriptional regulator
LAVSNRRQARRAIWARPGTEEATVADFQTPTPVRRQKLYEPIVEQLEAMMTSGKLSPGDQLPSERELMEQFSVGRPSIREALFALQKRGLIRIRNGERPRVTRPNASTLIEGLSGAVRHMLAATEGARDFQAARVIIEASLARHAARNATPNDIAKLEEALRRNEAAVGQYKAFSETDVAFHRTITSIARNAIFDALQDATSVWLAEQRLISTRDPAAEAAAIEAHRSIFAAIQAGDADAAEIAMQRHLEEVATYYWQQVATSTESVGTLAVHAKRKVKA